MKPRALAAALLSTLAIGCGITDLPNEGQVGPGGKGDNAWVSGETYEVDGTLTATLARKARGSYAKLANDLVLQEKLVDTQLKFAKNAMKARGYHVNQLAESVKIDKVVEADGRVTITYTAAIDLTASTGWFSKTLREFTVPLPLDPTDVKSRVGSKCADKLGPYSLHEYNYYYYFYPDQPDCDLELHQATLKTTKIHKQEKAYPEYDKLMTDLGDGKVGFKAAVLPGVAHDVVKGRLEDELGLTAEDVDGRFKRYRLQGEGNVEIVIDFYPNEYSFKKTLASYQLVYYHGHSSYGTQPFFNDTSKFTKGFYQIIAMSSCRSYSYYTRLIMKAKATADDPKGWKHTDVIANINSGWVGDSSATLKPILRKLLAGIAAIKAGRSNNAPDWLTIVKAMDSADDYPMHGAAGVRENTWKPTAQDPEQP